MSDSVGKIKEGKFNGNYVGIGIKEQTFNTAVYPNVGASKERGKVIYSIYTTNNRID